MKNIVVTGATGFIGSSLVDQLIKDGNNVFPIGRSLKSYCSNFIKKNLINFDLTHDKRPNFNNIDCVCILASKQPFYDNNFAGLEHLSRNSQK